MRLAFYSLFLLFGTSLSGQTSQVEFGKNRVQYHKDFDSWERYESDNFITHWYGEGRDLGQSVVQIAEYDFGYVQKMLEHRMNQKIQLIVYRDVTDLKQSNIGSEEVFSLSSNQSIGRSTSYIADTRTKFYGNKAFVYFNGDHTDLRRQIREAMASVYLEHMLYGSSVQEVVQNAVLLNLPPWFKTGLVSYLGEDWNTEKDDQLRQLMQSGEYEDFEDLAADYPTLAGHSFWYFVAENYGKPTVSNLLYLTRTYRSVENGFLYILGGNYEATLYNWQEFYNTRHTADLASRAAPQTQEIAVKNKRNLPITNVKVSPDGSRIAYVLNEIGRYKVYTQNIATGERELIFKGGQRNLLQATDYNYPLLDFSPNNQELAVLYEVRDRPRLMQYDLNTGKDVTKDLDVTLDRVFSMAYLDPGTFVMSALAFGQSDIYTYLPATRNSIKITNDFWDDLDVATVKVRGRRGILFSSNRPDPKLGVQKLDTLLPIGDFDIFYYDLDNRPGELVQVTDTELADESNPVPINGTFFSYIGNESGIRNRYQGYVEEYIDHYERTIYLTDGSEIVLHADSTLERLDTALVDSTVVFPVMKERAVTQPTTNLNTSIHRQDATGKSEIGVELFLAEAGQKVRTFTFDTTSRAFPKPTAFRRSSYQARGQTVPTFNAPTGTGETNGGIISPNQANPQPAASTADDYLFQTRFDDFVEPPAPVSEPNDNILLREPATPDNQPRPAGADTTGTRPNLTVVSPNAKPLPSKVKRRILRGERPTPELNRTYKFIRGRITASRLTFRLNYFKTEADNEPLFAGLNSFSGNPDGFTQQPVGLLFKGNIIDLFEDYSITGGLRVPFRFNGSEYFVTFEDRKHRLDRIISVYRRNRRNEEGSFGQGFSGRDPRIIEENTLLAQYGIRYPLDIFRSLRLTSTLRRDRVQTLPTEMAALQSRPENQARIGLRFEYVFDNTLNLATNLRMGTRYKFYVDSYKGFDVSFSSGGAETGIEPGFLGVAGFDARHYLRLDRRSILALRLAGATNFGSQKVLYYLGGADRAVGPEFNDGIPTPTNGNFVFQDLVNPLRGFDINIRNGGTHVLANAELRIPIFTYISRNIRSKFLRDFQVVPFFDVGSAWSGSNPYDEDNPVNLSTIEQGPVRVLVRRFRDPIIYGYGMGVRTSIFGYFLRADYGYGVETGIRGAGKLHVSMGLDF
ncbi:hypothetical protein [Neolewinella antarctica]|uniref:Uncharacterized protein n=1 Tax=Neolewinella antarctica TaxID=442734 RepID=A0ABX0XES1_9BACT|nr:hypothetical protein [Neolewinella antarctica]NJC27821.1 hypothetical protein [Neolewinella antarctica]